MHSNTRHVRSKVSVWAPKSIRSVWLQLLLEPECAHCLPLAGFAATVTPRRYLLGSRDSQRKPLRFYMAMTMKIKRIYESSYNWADFWLSGMSQDTEIIWAVGAPWWMVAQSLGHTFGFSSQNPGKSGKLVNICSANRQRKDRCLVKCFHGGVVLASQPCPSFLVFLGNPLFRSFSIPVSTVVMRNVPNT